MFWKRKKKEEAHPNEDNTKELICLIKAVEGTLTQVSTKLKKIEARQEELEAANKNTLKELATYYKILIAAGSEVNVMAIHSEEVGNVILNLTAQIHSILKTLKENGIHVPDSMPSREDMN